MPQELTLINQYKAVPPVDVVALIRALGIDYREQPMAPDQSGYFSRFNNRYIIGVNLLDGLQRRRFTAAHELGHYVLHRDLLREGQHFDRLYGTAARSNQPGPFSSMHEVQANQFAADLLMPAGLVAPMFWKNRSIESVAKAFQVSKPAAEIRLKNLGLL